ncbi:NrtR DNA-binding winged helix domain-containing protein [Pseudoalteromonas sp. SR44-2]|uniref:NUDIX hydrolase n=1 Tax=Pseudoalteromonas sp. SR44-2 TaxID=2760937 RepID=UPI0021757B41|nr:hypothetical protein [Pseudoalteromonas sp. SR44-2]
MSGDNALECEWFDVNNVPPLMFDHADILKSGLDYLRYKVRHEPIGFSLLPEKFTFLELQGIYESILNKSLDKPDFRRKFQKMNLLGSVDLCGLKFVQTRGYLIAARGL